MVNLKRARLKIKREIKPSIDPRRDCYVYKFDGYKSRSSAPRVYLFYHVELVNPLYRCLSSVYVLCTLYILFIISISDFFEIGLRKYKKDISVTICNSNQRHTISLLGAIVE